jgi:hypothetical protein
VTDVKPDPWWPPQRACQRSCDECGAKLFPGDWLTQEGCCYCDAGLDLLTPWGA